MAVASTDRSVPKLVKDDEQKKSSVEKRRPKLLGHRVQSAFQADGSDDVLGGSPPYLTHPLPRTGPRDSMASSMDVPIGCCEKPIANSVSYRYFDDASTIESKCSLATADHYRRLGVRPPPTLDDPIDDPIDDPSSVKDFRMGVEGRINMDTIDDPLDVVRFNGGPTRPRRADRFSSPAFVFFFSLFFSSNGLDGNCRVWSGSIKFQTGSTSIWPGYGEVRE